MLETSKHDWKSWERAPAISDAPFVSFCVKSIGKKSLNAVPFDRLLHSLWLGVDTMGRARDPIKAKTPTGLTARHGWPGVT